MKSSIVSVDSTHVQGLAESLVQSDAVLILPGLTDGKFAQKSEQSVQSDGEYAD